MAKYDYFEDENKPSAASPKRGKTSGRGVRLFLDAASQSAGKKAGRGSAPAQKKKEKPASAGKKAAATGAAAPLDDLAPPQPSVFGAVPPGAGADFSLPASPDLAPPAGITPQSDERPRGQKSPKKQKTAAKKAADTRKKEKPGKTADKNAPAPEAELSGARKRAVQVFERIAGVFGVQSAQATGTQPSGASAKKDSPKKEKTAAGPAKKRSGDAFGANSTPNSGAVHKYPAGTFDFLSDDLAPPAAPYVPGVLPDLPDLPARRPPQPEKQSEPAAPVSKPAQPKKAKTPRRAKAQKSAPGAEPAGQKAAETTPVPAAGGKKKTEKQNKGIFAKHRQKAQNRRARDARLAAIESRLPQRAPKTQSAVQQPAAQDAAQAAASRAAAKHSRIALIVLSCLAVAAAAALIIGFSLTISSDAKRSSSFSASSATVCTQYMADYGEGEFTDFSEDTYDLYSMQGFFSARRMDFDSDGHEELLLLYCNEGNYYGDVWGLDDSGAFARLYTVPLSVNEQTGEVWLVLFKTGSKYYLGTQSGSMESDITFYRLKGSAFVQATGTGKYNSEKETYRRLGRNITGRLEFLKVTMLTQRQAEEMLSRLQEMISSFGTATIQSQSDLTEAQQRARAYLDVIDEASVRFGTGKLAEDGTRLQGLAVARLVDFDGDGLDELLLVYERAVTDVDGSASDYETYDTTRYIMEVYRCSGMTATLIFTNETLVTPSFDADARLVMLQKAGEETRVCTVTREVSDSAGRYTARVYRMADDTFSLLYSAEVEDTYGSKQYVIDGERVSADEFAENGTTVPYFYKADDAPDDSYTLIYLAGEEQKDALNETLSETNRVIEDLRAELD